VQMHFVYVGIILIIILIPIYKVSANVMTVLSDVGAVLPVFLLGKNQFWK